MSSSFIDRVRDIASVKELAEGLTELHGHGGKFTGKCPFHTEDTASFTVYPDSNHFHCFGCGRHGSAFDLIMFSENLDFWEAVVRLAGKYNIPLPEMTPEAKEAHVREQQVQDFLGKFVERSADKLKKHPEVLEYLRKEGITDESIEHWSIGYGMKVSESANKELAIASGLLVKAESGRLWQPMLDRIIFPIKRHGKVVQISGRKTADKDGDKKCPKFFLLNGRDGYPFNAHQLRKERVFLTEGAKDAILLEQAGFPACATIMISSKFKPEWLKLVGKETDCYVVNDGDLAGDNANKNISERLFDAGHKVYVIALPAEHDPASFIRDAGAGAFQELVDGAPSYIDFLIERVAPDLNSYDLPKQLNIIYSKLARLPGTSHERYIDKMSGRLKLSKQAIRKELREHLKVTQKRDDESGEATIDEWRIRRRATNPIFYNPSQDFIKDTLYYSIFFEIEGMGAFRPFVISSNKDCFPFTKDELLKRDMICRTSAVPSNFCRWSIGTDNPYNALNFLDGKTHIDPKDLYTKIKWYFKRFVRLPDPFYYDFLTLWCMATYHFRLYDSFGYIFINAMKRSGKTQTLSIIQQVAFNASMADALTEAVLKRRVNVDAATIIADEAEYFKAKLKDEKSMVFEVFNGGYKSTGRATMVDADTKMVEDFCTYSPKALANTQGLYDVLSDRCITLYLLRSEHSIPQFIESEHSARFQIIRDMLYCLSLEYISEIKEGRYGLVQPDNLPGRDWELWLPVLSIAAFLDNYNVVEPEEFELSDGTKKTIITLLERMTTMAVERREYRKALEEEMQPELRILQALWGYINEHDDIDEMYSLKALADHVKEELGWEKYYTKSLSKFIFDTASLASRTNKRDQKLRYSYDSSKARKIKMIHIKKSKLIERTRQLFGVDLTEDYTPNDPDNLLERNPFEDE
jgi:DNA primase